MPIETSVMDKMRVGFALRPGNCFRKTLLSMAGTMPMNFLAIAVMAIDATTDPTLAINTIHSNAIINLPEKTQDVFIHPSWFLILLQ